MYLFVQDHGAFVAKHQRRLRVTKDKQRLGEYPLLHLEHVLIGGRGVALSSDVVEACSDSGIPIHFLAHDGTPHSSLYSAGLTGTVLTRRAQLRAYDTERGVALAKAFVRGKLQNQANLLRYGAKYRKETDPAVYTTLTTVAGAAVDALITVRDQPGSSVEAVRDGLMGIEGQFAAAYWGALAHLVPASLDWPGRRTRGATDPFNAALNYGYGVLCKHVENALVLAGLDPYGGLLHADRPGKPSLVLDLVEEFRQAVVDRPLLGQVTRDWQIGQGDDLLLDADTRKRIVDKVNERLASSETYEGKRQPLRHILQQQARHLATFLRGERAEYTPFVMGW